MMNVLAYLFQAWNAYRTDLCPQLLKPGLLRYAANYANSRTRRWKCNNLTEQW